ncbi:MAG: biopolymer transporter ExbD [Nevskiaceae bacterium]|nr:MAG: biopolymer transporter ExbD [Nevskiaceae bacterium]
MKIRSVARAARTDIDMVPMINFAFLLLIFFMLAGTFTTAERTPVTPPHSRIAAPADPSGDVLLLTADGRAGFGGALLPESALPPRIAAWRAQHPGQPLRLKADASVDAARVVRVLQTLRAAGVERVAILAARAS